MSKVKNQYPTNVNRNQYLGKRKGSTIMTPDHVAQRIFDIVNPVYRPSGVLDVGCATGQLSLPWLRSNLHCVGFDKVSLGWASWPIPGSFIKGDFLKRTDWGAGWTVWNTRPLVVCNPPFNDEKGAYGRKLLPELFLRKIFELGGATIPTVLIAPMGFLKNQRYDSKRWKWVRDCGATITGELELPIDTFCTPAREVLVHASVLFFNIPGVPAKSFLH
jgi:predicted RNA methylase